MKTIYTFLFYAISFSFVSAQGIDFMHSDFEGAKVKAKAENKLIFVDAYTTWCGPCKYMSKNVFTDAKVGAYYNDKFINVKLDMEKGEGIAFSTKYKVKAYPSLLFINGDGELIHLSLGGRPVEDFIDLGYAANDPERQITTMKKRYEGGDKSADFLKKYTDAMTSAGMKNFDAVAQEYMATQEDWLTSENIEFLFDYSEASIASPLFQYMIKNKEAYIAALGQEKYNEKIHWAADQDRSEAGIARDDIPNLTEHYKNYFAEDQAAQKAKVTYFSDAMYSKDPVVREKFLAEIQLFLAAKPDLGSRFYNAVAWEVYEMTEDRNILKNASQWAQISIDGEVNSFNTDTQAAILYKLGKKDAAKIYAMQSIELAKQEGNDYSSTEALLSKINGETK